MIKAIIIDDEQKARETLSDSLSLYCKNIDVIAEADGVKTGLVVIKENNPDVVFLDIMMTDGSGFDLLELIPTINFEIIFVTAYDKFAVKAFEFSAVDYILKPIKPQQLIRAVGKLKKSEGFETINKKLEVLISNKNNLEKIALPSLDGLCFIRIEDIIRCESDGNYTTFYMNSGEKVIVTKLIKEYEEMLSPLTFYRIHKSHIINFKYIKKYTRGDGGSVIMNDGTKIEVSRRRKEGFVSALQIYK
ncbi:MAG: response regulator transcription factor [Bacteroidetes bacterium]|nr:response regulator transcription factor [Bacteroidota bacterium]MBL7103014.1 response regulator transcription factor [Bacteroidales bacterium]